MFEDILNNPNNELPTRCHVCGSKIEKQDPDARGVYCSNFACLAYFWIEDGKLKNDSGKVSKT
jgi:hypothetical protein